MNKSKKRAHFKKERSRETVSTRLWEADDALFFETVNRRHTNPAELLRQIVHEWAITMRLSGRNTDQPETAGPIRKLQEQILAEQLEPINEALATICHKLNVPLLENVNTPLAIANTQDGADPASDVNPHIGGVMRRVTEDMQTTLEKLSSLKKFTIAHYNLSAQTYAANWTLLKLILRYIVEPSLRPSYKDEANQTALAERDKGMDEGLLLAKHSALYFHSSELFYKVFFTLSEDIGENESSDDETPE